MIMNFGSGDISMRIVHTYLLGSYGVSECICLSISGICLPTLQAEHSVHLGQHSI